MATLNETINQVQNVFNDIESALQEQGVDTKDMKPTEYANAVRNIVNESIKEIGIFPAIIFTYSKVSEIPKTPLGGKWVVDLENKNGILVPPTGWYTDLSEVEDISTTSDQIWMTTATFKDNGDIYTNWITPFRISGKDGKDGKKGDQGVPGPVAGVIQYYYTPYYLEDKFGVPNTPTARYNNGILENITDGWTTTIDKSDDTVWWMSTASYNNNMANGDLISFTAPVRISTTESDKKQGTIRYYHLSNNPSLPSYTDSWLQWVDGVVPTLSKPYLYCYEATSYTQSEISKSPIYLLTTYSNGLKSIDFDYTCGPSQDSVSSEEQIWFDNTEDAITPNSETGYLGLNEDTKLLWCREKFIYVDESQNKVFYRILSSYTAAEKAAIIYSAGVFNPNVVYLRTSEQRPYVYYPEGLKLNDEGNIDSNGKEYYYFVLKYSYDDEFHKIQINDSYNFESAYTNGNWEKMESFEAVYSDIGVFKAANVGKFVFDDKYIFSQQGVDKTGAQRSYTEFSDWSVGTMNDGSSRKGIALAIETGEFIPNILLNAVTGKASFGGGTNTLNPDGTISLANGSISWDNEKLTVRGDIDAIGGGVFSSISDINERVEDMSDSVDVLTGHLNDYITETGETILQLNRRLDGAVSNFYKEGVPATDISVLKILFFNDINFEPSASDWDAHIGDTWTNILTYDSDSTLENYKTGGLSWRWCEGDGTSHSKYRVNVGNGYHWHLISDTDATRALLLAGEAKSIANSKTTTFVNDNPINPSNGDLWVVPNTYTGTTYVKGKTYVYNNEWVALYDIDLSDLEAMKAVFKRGASGMEGGLIFGEALGVFNQKGTEETSDDSLIGVLNGNPKYSDEKGHTIILAAGMDDSEPDVKAKIQNAKTMLCDNGDLKLGDALQFDAETSTLRVGDKIEIGTEDKCITVSETYYEYIYTDPSKNPITHYGKIEIGKDDHPTFQAYYNMKHTDEYDNRYDQHSSFSINMDGKQGCYGGGICKIDFCDNNLDVPHVSTYCIDTHLPGVPAMTVESNTISICNLAGGISGLRTFAKSIGVSETLDYSNSSASFCPQTLVIHGGATCNFYLPKNQNSQIGDTFELWLGNSGNVNIHGAKIPNGTVPQTYSYENFYINAGTDSWTSKTSHAWETPGVYKCLFTGDNWWIKWI